MQHTLGVDTEKYLEAEYDHHLERVKSLVRQPSVSSEDKGVQQAASLLAEMHRKAGFDTVELLATEGYPLVYALADVGAPVTLGVYAYYDTNTPGSGWTHDPFGAEVGDAPGFPDALFGVGVATKASYVAWLNAVEALQASVGLPVNIVSLVEGEEWLGSPHVADAIRAKASHFQQAKAIVWPGYGQTASGEVRLVLGTKGFLHVKLTVSAERWGRGPTAAVHGSAQGILDSPTWRLVDALSTIASAAGQDVHIDGFGDEVLPPSDEFLQLVRSIAQRYDNEELGNVIPGIDGASKIAQYANDLAGENLLLKYLFEPTMNLSGIAAGYTGPGTWQYGLPSTASCTIDIRMPPNMNPERTLQRLRKHLDDRGFPDIELDTLAAYGPSQSSPADAVVRASIESLRSHGLEAVVWPRRGSSGPLGIFADLLGVPALSGFGLGHATSAGPDTFMVLQPHGRVGGLVDTERFFASFIQRFAALSGK